MGSALSSSTSLDVWLGGAVIGHLSQRGRDRLRFGYAEEVLARWPMNTPLLSCSLPVRKGRLDGRPFFAGLLPEGEHRRALAQQAGCLPSDVFSLLARFGRDVAGAISVGTDYLPNDATAIPYVAAGLDTEVARLASHPLGVHDDSELSIAGLQDKLLLVQMHDGGWARPAHGYPSTHILKVDDRFHTGLVIAEHDCLRIAQEAGIEAAEPALARVAGLDCLIVRRFDRTDDPAHSRVHIEDACQALGIDLEVTQGTGKYEPSQGLSLRAIAGQLDAWGAEPSTELTRLLEHVAFTVAIGNADDHGKNISFLHTAPGVIQLAPLYDTVPTMMWPNLRTRAALSIGGAIDLPAITFADIVAEARSWGMKADVSRGLARDVLERIHVASSRIDSVGMHDVSGFVSGRVKTLLEQSVRD